MVPAVEAEGLVRTFGEVRAVDGIDLSVARGEVFGFLGPNGAGKSTLVNDILYPALARKLHNSTQRIGSHKAIHGLGQLFSHVLTRNGGRGHNQAVSRVNLFEAMNQGPNSQHFTNRHCMYPDRSLAIRVDVWGNPTAPVP